MTLHRLFYALMPSASQIAAIAAHRSGEDITGAVADHRLHLTLAIGNDHEREPSEEMAEMLAMGTAVAAEPFEIMLERCSAGPDVLALRPRRCPTGLRTLHRELDRRMNARRMRRTGWSFAPHVTLRYRKGPSFDRAIDPLGWSVRDFVLIHSLVGETRHIELGRWPLIQRQYSLPF